MKYWMIPITEENWYIMKENSIYGAFKVTSTWYKEDKPLWPDEVREGKVKYPWRARLELIKLGLAYFEKLVPELTFIVKKERTTAYLVGTPANLRRPIPVRDAKTLINSL